MMNDLDFCNSSQYQIMKKIKSFDLELIFVYENNYYVGVCFKKRLE